MAHHESCMSGLGEGGIPHRLVILPQAGQYLRPTHPPGKQGPATWYRLPPLPPARAAALAELQARLLVWVLCA